MRDFLTQQQHLELFYGFYFLFIGIAILLTLFCKKKGATGKLAKKLIRCYLIAGTVFFLIIGSLIQQFVASITLSVPLIIAGSWIVYEVFLKGKRITKIFNTELSYEKSLEELVLMEENNNEKLGKLCQYHEQTQMVIESTGYTSPQNNSEALIVLKQAVEPYLIEYGLELYDMGEYYNNINTAKRLLDKLCADQKLCYNDLKYSEIAQNILNLNVQVVNPGNIAVIPIQGKHFNQVLYLKSNTGKVTTADACLIKIIGRMVY